MTSTPPNREPVVSIETPETEKNQQQPSGSFVRESTEGEGYTNYDPVSGLYYYADGVNPTMYFDGYSGSWLYWNEEGQFYHPVNIDAAKYKEQLEQQQQAAATQQQQSSGAAATLGGPASSSFGMGSAFGSSSSAANSQQQAAPTKIPDEDKHPLPFRLTSGIQSERDRLLGSAAGGKRAKQRIDWGAALDNVSYSSYGGSRGASSSPLGHFSQPPILPPRFYYPHVIPGTYYDFLNVRPNASVEEVEESVQWWELVGYPNASEADPERADKIHRLVMEAAIIITNATLRAQYDLTLPIPGKSTSRTMHGMIDVSAFVPRVLHFHQDGKTTASGAGSRTSSRPTSLTSTPSKYGSTPATTSQDRTGSNEEEEEHHANALLNMGPNLAERLFAAVSDGIFGPPRTKPKSKKYAVRGQEWIEDERRKLEEEGGQQQQGSSGATGSNDDHQNNGNSASSTVRAASNGFKVTNTSTNKQHADPNGNKNIITPSSNGASKGPTPTEQSPDGVPAKPPL
jgi:curved DNA-binding protein CbpA